MHFTLEGCLSHFDDRKTTTAATPFYWQFFNIFWTFIKANNLQCWQHNLMQYSRFQQKHLDSIFQKSDLRTLYYSHSTIRSLCYPRNPRSKIKHEYLRVPWCFSPKIFLPYNISPRDISPHDISPSITFLPRTCFSSMTFLPKGHFSWRHFSQHYFSHILFSGI